MDIAGALARAFWKGRGGVPQPANHGRDDGAVRAGIVFSTWVVAGGSSLSKILQIWMVGGRSQLLKYHEIQLNHVIYIYIIMYIMYIYIYIYLYYRSEY